MRKVCDFIVGKGKLFFVLFIVLALCGAVTMNFVKVNYDLSVYLPADSDSRVSMEVLYDEFGDNGTLTVMASGLSLTEAYDFKQQIAGVEHVKSALWVDTALEEPLANLRAESGDSIALLWPETADMTDSEFMTFFLGMAEDPSSFTPGPLEGEAWLTLFDAMFGQFSEIQEQLETNRPMINMLWPETATMTDPEFMSFLLDLSEHPADYKPAFMEESAWLATVQSMFGQMALPTEDLEASRPFIAMFWPETAGMTQPELLAFLMDVAANPASYEPGVIQTSAWLNAYEEMFAPLTEVIEPFFKDGKALYQLTFEGTAYETSTMEAIDSIKALGKELHLAGASANSYAMQTTVNKELLLAAAIIAPLLLLLLFSATRSWFEPVVYLTVIGISVLLNMGSNLILGSISYLTNSVAALIQVAVSMDYSIFLFHSYKRERQAGLEAAEAAKTALRKSMSPVSASSLTTIAGFVALMFMQYTLGMDIGLVLTKGIVFSLLTAFLFMPGFLVMTDKVIMRGEHRTLFEVLRRKPRPATAQKPSEPEALPARASLPAEEEIDKSGPEPKKPAFGECFAGGLIRLRYVVPVLFLALMVCGFYFQGQNNFQYGELASAGGDGSTIMTDRAAIEETFGSQNNVVVMIPRSCGEEKEAELAGKLAEVENVSGVQSYAYLAAAADAQLPSYLEAQLRSENYSRIILTVDTAEESEEAFATVDAIRAVAEAELPEGGFYLLGSSVSTQELREINNRDYTLSTTLAIAFIFVILLFNTQGLVLPLLMALLIEGSIWINMGVPAVIGMPLVYLGYLFVSCFQMGCTIDYGILLSSHYREYRKTMDKLQAARSAFLTAFPSITLSASILALVGFCFGLTGTVPSTSNIGLFLGLGTVVSYLSMMFVLPCVLVVFDRPILATTLRPRRKKQAEKKQSAQED